MSLSWQLGFWREEQQGRHPEALDSLLPLLVKDILYRVSEETHRAKHIVNTLCMLKVKVMDKCDTHIIQVQSR